MSEWQPIDSAPRNGRTIIVYAKGWLQPTAGRYVARKALWSDGVRYWENLPPTHWREFPAPPQTEDMT